MTWERLTESKTGAYGDYASSLVDEYFKSLDEMGGNVTVEPLEDVSAQVVSLAYTDFIYDRPSKCILLGGGNFHSAICSVLFVMHKLYEQKPPSLLAYDTIELIAKTVHPGNDFACLSYLNEYGVYQSSMRMQASLQIGEAFSFNAQERRLFKRYQLSRIKAHESSDTVFSGLLRDLDCLVV